MLFRLDDVVDLSVPQVRQADGVGLDGAPDGRVCSRNSELAAVLPVVQMGRHYHVVSAGLWAMHELLFHLLRMSGPARVTLATWSMNETAVRQLVGGLDEGLITELHALLDVRVRVRTPEVLAFLRCQAARVRVTANHAKVLVIENEHWQVAVVSSANMTNNPRYEATVIDCHADAARLHRSWIETELRKAHRLDG
jgi:hypothetical protein